MDENTVYEDLYKKLAITPTGVPKAEKLLPILKILFTPEEAELALVLPFMPTPLPHIADAADMAPEQAERILSHMADKGLVYAVVENDVSMFMLFSVSWTLFKFPLMTEVPGVDYEELKRLCRQFLAEDTLIGDHTMGPGGAHIPISRVLPVQENLSPDAEVLLQDRVYHYIDQADLISVGQCACKNIVGACDAPREVCMGFGREAKYLVERKMARFIDKEEAKRIHKMASDAGLVSVTTNTKDEIGIICHCCPCCCAQLGAGTKHGRYDLVPKGAYIASIDEDDCTDCGSCLEECPMRAIGPGEGDGTGTTRVDSEKCIGCGLCVPSCPTGAISLVRRPQLPALPNNIMEWTEKAVETRGVKEAFLKELTIKKSAE